MFLAVVVEGYSETLKESNAVIDPDKSELILDKYSFYDVNGTGFISPMDLAFLMIELAPPIGFKDDNNLDIKH